MKVGLFGRFLVMVGALCSVLLAFQNCSQANFIADNSVTGLDIDDGDIIVDPGTGRKTLTVTVDTGRRYPSDILFILDESASMDKIRDEVRSGFAALSADIYPAQSVIAVTNMAPAYESGGQIDPSKAFRTTTTYLTKQPGFLRLINRATIAEFLMTRPSASSRFSAPGCSESWFTPTQRDSSGQACIVGATQINMEGTGEEPGAVSLKQLIQNAQLKGQSLFRKDAALTVIFVSDTHDPGSSYYGKSGAPSRMPTYSELRDLVYTNQPGLRGLKFNAIVPLPRASNSALNGVNVIGRLPQTAAEEYISGEDVHGYSYLPIVKASAGAAMHPINNDWQAGVKKMVEEIGVFENPTVKLGIAATKIIEVKVNGQTLSASEYSLIQGGLNLQIQRRANWPAVLDIVVAYD